MSFTSTQITIAITVYSRRTYIKQAIASALNQTRPVKVIVVEDCGPDPGLEAFVKEEFGSRIEYIRNVKRRGLFGNWNACIEYCQTEWLSILHDDDYLEPGFIEAMIELGTKAPNCGLYFGYTVVADVHGKPIPTPQYPRIEGDWKPVHLRDFLLSNPFAPFPGHLFRVDYAKAVGGFRETSLYSGDWEFWVRMAATYEVARTRSTVAVFRHHDEWDRGTNKVLRSGRPYALAAMQQKRNFALFRKRGEQSYFCRRTILSKMPLPSRYLIRFADYFSPYWLKYNVGLFLRSEPPNWRYGILQTAVRVFGANSVKLLSKCYLSFIRK